MTMLNVQHLTDRLGLTSPTARLRDTTVRQVRADILAHLLNTVDEASAGAIGRASRHLLGEMVAGRITTEAYQAAMAAAGREARELVAAIRAYLEAVRDG